MGTQTPPKQMALPPKFAELFRPHRYKVYHGGRGGCKSWSFARALIGFAYTKPVRILCAREFQNSIADSVHRLISDQISLLKLDPWFKITQNSITSTAGAQFLFKGLQRSIQEIKSTEGIDYCWVEEAQTVSAISWEILIPTVRNENSEIWISFNPDAEEDPTYDRFITHRPPDAFVQKVGWQDNLNFPAVLEQERLYLLRVDPEAYAHVWEGECRKISDAVIFKGRFMIDGFDEPDDNTRFYYGQDFGFSQDPTAVVRCFIRDNRLYVDREAWGIGVELDNINDFVKTVPGADTWPIKADSSRPETISHERRHGLKVTAAQKWPGSVEDGIAVMKGFDKILIHPRCEHTAQEFGRYSYKVDKQTNDILPVIVDKDNHCIDAIRYALDGLIKQSNFFDGCSQKDFPSREARAA